MSVEHKLRKLCREADYTKQCSGGLFTTTPFRCHTAILPANRTNAAYICPQCSQTHALGAGTSPQLMSPPTMLARLKIQQNKRLSNKHTKRQTIKRNWNQPLMKPKLRRPNRKGAPGNHEHKWRKQEKQELPPRQEPKEWQRPSESYLGLRSQTLHTHVKIRGALLTKIANSKKQFLLER